MDDLELLRFIDGYLDEAPRFATTQESIGPFTLFVHQKPGWPCYARPTPGTRAEVSAADIQPVRARQRELEVTETFEWVADLVPSVGPAAAEAGLEVTEHPLMYLDVLMPTRPPEGFEVRFATAEDDLALLHAVAEVGFGNRGTDIGEAGIDAAAEIVARGTDAGLLTLMHERLAQGLTVTAAVYELPTGIPVAVGAHQPVDEVAEIVGVATLPEFRRRGIGAALTSVLVRDALMRNCHSVFLSADDDDVAHVYERMGFRRIGTAGAAEPPPAAR